MGMGFKDVLELRTQVSRISMSFGGEIIGVSGQRRSIKDFREHGGSGGTLWN